MKNLKERKKGKYFASNVHIDNLVSELRISEKHHVASFTNKVYLFFV